MNRNFLAAFVLLILCLSGWFLYYFSDSQVIKRQFHAAAAGIGKEGEETPVMIALKMRPVKDVLAPLCEVTVPERNYRESLDPALVVRYLIIYRSSQSTLLLDIEEIEVDLPEKGRAEVSALVRVVANLNRPDFFEETHRLAFSLQKNEKKWLIHRAILPDALVSAR